MVEIARKTGTSKRTWWYFFNESFFDDTALPTQSAKVRIAVCKNREGTIAFIGTNILARGARDIVRIYGYRWQIEVYFKDIKYKLSFGDYRMRSVGANTRWQVLTLIAANLLELIRKTKL